VFDDPRVGLVQEPFVLGDRRALAALFQKYGAASVDLMTRRGTARFHSTSGFVGAELRGWLVMGVTPPEPKIKRILAEAETILSSDVTADGGLAFDVSAHVVTFSGGS
jgi:hypothetical protein